MGDGAVIDRNSTRFSSLYLAISLHLAISLQPCRARPLEKPTLLLIKGLAAQQQSMGEKQIGEEDDNINNNHGWAAGLALQC